MRDRSLRKESLGMPVSIRRQSPGEWSSEYLQPAVWVPVSVSEEGIWERGEFSFLRSSEVMFQICLGSRATSQRILPPRKEATVGLDQSQAVARTGGPDENQHQRPRTPQNPSGWISNAKMWCLPLLISALQKFPNLDPALRKGAGLC